MKNQPETNQSLRLLLGVFLLGLVFYACNPEAEPEPTKPTLGALMAQKLNDTLQNRGAGFAFAIYEGDQLQANGSGGFQMQVVDGGTQKSFTPDTKMHIASMTKTLTAMAFLKVAQQKNIRTTDRIAPYLPASWPRGAGIDNITFGDLLTHKSGIIGLGSSCQNGSFTENIYSGLRRLIAKGTTNRGNYCYQNANFGLFRVLIPSILGYRFTGNETADDSETQRRYLQFLQSEIFEKIGITSTSTSHPTNNPTFTYNFPVTSSQSGWNQGNFIQSLGGYGMYLTTDEAARIYANAFSTTAEKILTTSQKDTLLIKNLGCYKAVSTLGEIYFHDGWWYSSLSASGQGLRTIWVKLPNNITCVLFVNTLRWQNNSLGFPFNNGNILGFVYNAYAQAKQASTMRLAADAPPLIVEHPEPH